MAGTRRQSRARDTIKTHYRRRSASRLVSIVPDAAVATNANVGEIADSADEGSPHPEGSSQPETPANRSVAAFCRKCNSKIGDFYNSWHKVTSSYYSPALLGSYRSLLRTSGERKEASDSTEIAGCIIELTRCPSCDNYLGFVVVETPTGRKRFRGREFFKLQHIELQCETSSSKAITVEPQEDVAPDLVASEDSNSSSPVRVETVANTMELDTPLSSSHPLWAKPAPSEQLHQRQHSHSSESVRQSFRSSAPISPVAVSRSPINRGVETPVAAPIQTFPQPSQPHSGHLGSSVQKALPEPVVNGHRDAHKYPQDPRNVHFDAIERLQTQTSQNTSALAAQARTQMESAEIVRQIESSLRGEFQGQLQRQDQELRRMSETVNQLARELAECRQNMVGLVHEVHVARTENARRSSDAQPSYQDETLELMARRIADISHRAVDLESLRDLVSILGGKVHRLEAESAANRQLQQQPTYPAQPTLQSTHQSSHPPPPPPQHPPTHSHHVAQAPPLHPPPAPAYQTPARPTSNPQAFPVHEKPAAIMPPESAQRPETGATQNGWATVNAGVKRVFESSAGSPHQSAGSEPASPKRPKLTTPGESQDSQSMPQPPPEPAHILPSQTQPPVGPQPPTHPTSYPGQHTGPHPGSHHGSPQIAPQGINPGTPSSQPYRPYNTQDGPSEQSWIPESQRMAESRPARGRGSRGGRGPGSRGGRVRKSMQGQHHSTGTPEWERDHWSAVPDSQASPSVYDGHSHSVRGIVRRGGGGGGSRADPMSVERSNEWTPEIGPRTIYHNQDSPIEVKKTRSKPIRNEDGILVRKDGRPDRRSQSSAANLRKVHARKEEQQREAEAGSTPSGLRHTMSVGPETPGPSSPDSQEHDVTDSVRKKHHDILGRIFPEGIDTSRKQHDYAHQVFNEDRDHTAHPRSQGIKPAKKASPQVKKERERSEIAETQASGDVEMAEAGASATPHAHEDSQTPGEGEAADVSGQEPESRVQVPETQATESSATLAAQSTDSA
ncbi:hypothetical protein OPT61_g8309 [Boeremia exigua]|uniref:Uncharacterized protein n=1 Tax=Boeremia exigua TaxID=749465 RepID=A0ACC2HYS3_9PLEO|nr:hypothetical protein OPT61_g8309 [Boeremia exigua]